jgi:hypothetical protein
LLAAGRPPRRSKPTRKQQVGERRWNTSGVHPNCSGHWSVSVWRSSAKSRHRPAPAWPPPVRRHTKRRPIRVAQRLSVTPPLPIRDRQNCSAAEGVDCEADRQPPVGAIDERVGDCREVGKREQEPGHERDG